MGSGRVDGRENDVALRAGLEEVWCGGVCDLSVARLFRCVLRSDAVCVLCCLLCAAFRVACTVLCVMCCVLCAWSQRTRACGARRQR